VNIFENFGLKTLNILLKHFSAFFLKTNERTGGDLSEKKRNNALNFKSKRFDKQKIRRILS